MTGRLVKRIGGLGADEALREPGSAGYLLLGVPRDAAGVGG
jgi:hypothetical protein